MPKITFDDDLELEDAVEPLLPANIPEDAEVESSEPSSSDDEAAPEALDSRKQKSKLQGKVRSERLAQQEKRHEQRLKNKSKQTTQASSKNRKVDALPQASDSEPDEEEFVPLPSSSKFTQDAHPTSNKLPTDLFAQAAAEREAQQTAEEDNKRAKASLKAKVRKRKAQIGPKEGSSVLLPRGDVIKHLPSQSSQPNLTAADPSRPLNANSSRLIAPYSKKRKLHQSKAATKMALDKSTAPLTLHPESNPLKGKKQKQKHWKDRVESTRRNAALVAGRHSGAGSVKGFVSGSLRQY